MKAKRRRLIRLTNELSRNRLPIHAKRLARSQLKYNQSPKKEKRNVGR